MVKIVQKVVDDQPEVQKVVDEQQETLERRTTKEDDAETEQGLEDKLLQSSLIEKHMEIHYQLMLLEERELSLKDKEYQLNQLREQVISEKEIMEARKAHIEEVKADIDEKGRRIVEEINKLEDARDEYLRQQKVLEDDRAEHVLQQKELDDQKEWYRVQNEFLLNEVEMLKLDKLKFEEEWETLDEKRELLDRDLHQLTREREMLEKSRKAEEDCLIKEREALRLEKDLFAADMQHQQSLLLEKAQTHHDQLLRDFESRRTDLESNLQKRLEDKEKILEDKEKAFEEERGREYSDISRMKEELLKGKQDIDITRNVVVNCQLGIQKEMDEIGILTKKLKDQQEDFIHQRSRFFSFVEKLKNCGHRDGVLETVSSYALEVNRSPNTAERNSSNTGGQASWLRKCTSNIFRFSSSGTSQKPVVLEDNIEAVVEDAIAFVGDNIGNEGSTGESRKRAREPVADDTESLSESITAGGCRKRLQTAAASTQNPADKVGKAAAEVSEASVDLSEEAETGVETQKFRTVKDVDIDANEIQAAEVNDTSDDHGSSLLSDDEDDEAGEKTVGRKLWKFLTT